MAELYLAKEPRADRLVVIKRILPYLAEEMDFVRMFLDEARIAAQLHHANIVEVYELGQLEGSIFIAMEFVDGIDLRRVLQKEQERGGVIPPGIAAWMVARLCEGLHYAHFKAGADGKPMGIIHRDVSPQNLMVSYDADVKLVDFGIAKATAWMSRSKPGVIKGKFLYLAPEQLGQEVLDHRTDLFAVGTLLYELTTGKSPFYRQTTEAVIYSIRMEEPKPPSAANPSYPRMLEDVVMQCLKKDREERFQTGEEVQQALEEFLAVELPTSHEDVADYVAGLFGQEGERTGIYIPENARSKIRPAVAPFENLPGESTKPARAGSLRQLQGRQPEGRRPTAELQLAGGEEKTTSAIGGGLRDLSTTAPLEPVAARLPVDAAGGIERTDPEGELAERTQPLAQAAERDGESTAVLSGPPARKSGTFRQAGADEPDQTVLMTDAEKAGKLPVRGPAQEPEETYGKAWSRRPEPSVISPLPPGLNDTHGKGWPRDSEASLSPLPALTPPTPSGESGDPSVSTNPSRPGFQGYDDDDDPHAPTRHRQSFPVRPPDPKPRPSLDRRPSAIRPAPPIPTPSSGELSAPLVESGIVDLSETNQTVEQLAPVPSPAAPLNKHPGPQRRPHPKPRPVGDPDDLIDTIDYANVANYANLSNDTLSTVPPADDKQKWIILGAVGMVGFALLLALVWALWPTPVEETLPDDSERSSTGPRAPADAPAADAPNAGSLVTLELQAPRGTLLEIDGREVSSKVQVPPGKVTVVYRCPIKKKGRATRRSATVVAPSDAKGPIAVPLSCR